MEKRSSEAEKIEISEPLAQFLDPAYTYQFTQNPDVVRTKDDALREGINCVSLAHLAIKELFGYSLPPHLCCAELYLDQEYFTPVKSLDQLKIGDLVWFGVENAPCSPNEVKLRYDSRGKLVNWHEFPVKHVAIFAGKLAASAVRVSKAITPDTTSTESGSVEPLLLHATQSGTAGVVLWPLSHFSEYARYRKLWGITRFVTQPP